MEKDLRGFKVVAIGGGNGLSTLLSGMKGLVAPEGEGRKFRIEQLAAIVTVSDDGGSSGG